MFVSRLCILLVDKLWHVCPEYFGKMIVIFPIFEVSDPCIVLHNHVPVSICSQKGTNIHHVIAASVGLITMCWSPNKILTALDQVLISRIGF